MMLALLLENLYIVEWMELSPKKEKKNNSFPAVIISSKTVISRHQQIGEGGGMI